MDDFIAGKDREINGYLKPLFMSLLEFAIELSPKTFCSAPIYEEYVLKVIFVEGLPPVY